MGQFKPMPKMETTEPKAVLKLKVGGGVVRPSVEDTGFSPMSASGGGSSKARFRRAPTPMVGGPAQAVPVARGLTPLKKGGSAKKECSGGPIKKR